MNSTSQYYYNARWYDPNLGRFTTEDPIRSGLNWYAYANNNPLRFVDPTGLYRTDYWNMTQEDIEESNEIREKIENDEYGTNAGTPANTSSTNSNTNSSSGNGGSTNINIKNQNGNNFNISEVLRDASLSNYPYDEFGESDLDVDSDIVSIIERFIDDDFTGIVLAGDYLQATALLTGAYEIGDVYEFKNGKIVNKVLYQSVTVGGEVDLGIEGGLSLTIFPGLSTADAFGKS